MAGSAFDEELAKVVDAANHQRGMTPSDDLIRALNTLADLPPQQRETARTVVGNALARVASPTGAGFLSVWLGAGVENDATPEPSCQPVIDTLLIEPDEMRLSIVWRGTAPALRPYSREELASMPLRVVW